MFIIPYDYIFNFSDHQNWFGMDDNLGPVAISMKRERVEKSQNLASNITSPFYRYRLLIRTSEVIIFNVTYLLAWMVLYIRKFSI